MSLKMNEVEKEGEREKARDKKRNPKNAAPATQLVG